MSVRRIGFLVRGRVQGVGFRAAARAAASRCGVTGFVRNRIDGAVDGEAQGDPVAVAAFVDWLHEGPTAARVADVVIDAAAVVDGEAGFTVRR